MANYIKEHLTDPAKTPQNEAIPGSTQVPNSAGGYSWEAGPLDRFRRFLVLGSQGGSYYADERKLTKENMSLVRDVVRDQGLAALDALVAISVEGRALKQDPTLFAYAVLCAAPDQEVRQQAFSHLEAVVRTGSMLLTFMGYLANERSFGGYARRALQGWYVHKSPESLAYQALKSTTRGTWTHTGVIRNVRPKALSDEQNTVLHWIRRGWNEVGADPHPSKGADQIWAYETLKRLSKADERGAAKLIADYRLPREAVPTQFLTSKLVWEALLVDMPIGALVRNLPTLTRIGLIAPGSDATKDVVRLLTDQNRLVGGRVHPIALLMALETYKNGKSEKSDRTWTPNQKVVDALDQGFYLAFKSVEPSGKRLLLAVDTSGSMMWPGSTIAGCGSMRARDLAAAMALVTLATEPDAHITAFAGALQELPITPRMRLDDVKRAMDRMPGGSTDCALPVAYALQHNMKVDAITVYTDSETAVGNIHPAQAVKTYRKRTGLETRFVVQAMVANKFTIADPNDRWMLDIAGADSGAPALIADFCAGRL